MQLMLCNPSPRVVRLMERSGLINKLGREVIFVRVHDAVVSCQRSLMQMEAGGSMGPVLGHTLSSMWQPVHVAATVSSSTDPQEHMSPAGLMAGQAGNGQHTPVGGQPAGKDADR